MLQKLIRQGAPCLLLLMLALPSLAQSRSDSGTRSPHGPLAVPCTNCHTSASWKPIRGVPEFDHSKTKFPLRGLHENVACTQCHAKPVFTNVGTKCADCHADIHRGKMGANCESCHTVKGWKVNLQQIQGHTNRFPLVGAHAVAACEDCHKNGGLSNFSTMSTACYSCHANDYKGATVPNHVLAKFSADCQTCHTMNSWAGATVDHAQFGFPLTGAHATVLCTQCHINNNFNLTSTACASCHLPDFQKTTNPNHALGNFPQGCEQCHTTSAWQPATFDHNMVGFPLTGGHANLQCAQCHVNNNFNLTSTACVTCHLPDFQKTTNPNHVQFNLPQTCQQCHTTAAWQPASFDHNTVGFPLTGGHANLQCAQCHTNNNYNLTTTACVSCHQADFNNAKSPVDHIASGFPTTCQNCHDTSLWTNGKFDHSTTGWALTGTHQTTPCSQCHVNNNYSLTNTACATCHQADYNNAKTPVDHIASGFPTTCQNCHDTVVWTNAKFDHATTGWALTGFHLTTPCAQCHVNNNYNLTNTACVSCHLTDFQNTTNPNHAQQNISQTCESCHNTAAWQPAQFDHSKSGFPLTGTHATTPCAQCHVNNNYNLTNTACVSCHQTDYNNAKTPIDHIALSFPTACQNCHDTVVWTNGKFDHATTGWALTGTHATTPCAQCHVNNNYNLTNTACVTCHQTDFNNAKTPVDHIALGFPTTCQSCHDTVVWTNGKFDHATTGWALTGTHATTPCAQCHVNNNYNLTSTACATCHQTDYNNAKLPVDHIASGFAITCQNCHDTVVWTTGKFDHATTGWALTGTHATTACDQCHVNGNYKLNNTNCVTCHQTDYNNAKTPIDHVALSFPTTCQSCHDTVVWTNGKFDHATTGWALTGTHATTPCAQCHVNNNYNLTNTACVACHQTDYNNAKTPVDHIALGFPTTCQSCHDTVVWTNGKFDHATTGWALTGTHATTPCAQCHVNNNYNLTTFACASCHQTDYNNAKTPVDHIAAAFPTTCETCHDTVVWTTGKFDHTTTGWALTGTHATTPCAQCHVNGNYKLTNTACVACHQNDYNTATTPVNHVALSFPTTCQNCHDTVVWTTGKFDHATTGWPLTGMHATIACNLCHVNNNYTLNNTNCVTCHQTDYNNTTNPNHKAAGFPTTCQTCHDTSNWLNATFNHSYFPMNHGNANGVCATCHTNPSDYTVFSCTNCHTKSQTDSHHQGVRGYVYASPNCYSCHPSGRAG